MDRRNHRSSAASVSRASTNVVPVVDGRNGCSKALVSPLAPQQKSIYVKAFLVWSVCTLGGWLSIDTEYLPLWSHCVGFGFFLTITTRKTRWLGALVIAALVLSSIMYQLLPQNWVTTLTNSVGYGIIALALMLAFLCRRAATQMNTFDVDYSPLQLPEELLQILMNLSGHPAVIAATAHAAAALPSLMSGSSITKDDDVTSDDTPDDTMDDAKKSDANHSSDDTPEEKMKDTQSSGNKYGDGIEKPYLADEYHSRLIDYPASRADLCALICQMHRMAHHQMMMARSAAAGQAQQISKLSAQLDAEVERRLRAERSLARANDAAAASLVVPVTPTVSSVSSTGSVSPSPNGSTTACECGRRYDRNEKGKRRDRPAASTSNGTTTSTSSTNVATISSNTTSSTSTTHNNTNSSITSLSSSPSPHQEWEKERTSLANQLQMANKSRNDAETALVVAQAQISQLKIVAITTTRTASSTPSSSSTSLSPSSSSTEPLSLSDEVEENQLITSTADRRERSLRDWIQLRLSLQRAESTIESYDNQLNELRRSSHRRHQVAKAASARMASRLETLVIDNSNLRKQLKSLSSSSAVATTTTTTHNTNSMRSRSTKSQRAREVLPSDSSVSPPSSSSPVSSSPVNDAQLDLESEHDNGSDSPASMNGSADIGHLSLSSSSSPSVSLAESPLSTSPSSRVSGPHHHHHDGSRNGSNGEELSLSFLSSYEPFVSAGARAPAVPLYSSNNSSTSAMHDSYITLDHHPHTYCDSNARYDDNADDCISDNDANGMELLGHQMVDYLDNHDDYHTSST